MLTLWQSLGANNLSVFINVVAHGHTELGWPKATPVNIYTYIYMYILEFCTLRWQISSPPLTLRGVFT